MVSRGGGQHQREVAQHVACERWYASLAPSGGGLDAAPKIDRGTGRDKSNGQLLYTLEKLTVLTALVLICSVTVTPDLGECTPDSATAVMRVPAEFGNPITCLMHAQAYLAETSIGKTSAQTTG
jgi:hypothetical protein